MDTGHKNSYKKTLEAKLLEVKNLIIYENTILDNMRKVGYAQQPQYKIHSAKQINHQQNYIKDLQFQLGVIEKKLQLLNEPFQIYNEIDLLPDNSEQDKYVGQVEDLSLVFSAADFTTEEIVDTLRFFATVYRDVSGDDLVIKGISSYAIATTTKGVLL